MVLHLEFYDKEKLNDLVEILKEKEIAYDLLDNEEIDIYDLNKYNKAYRRLDFYVEFINKNGKLVYFEIKETYIANYNITLF